MSAIAGIVHFDGRPADAALVAGMLARMAHRGPDGLSHVTAGPVAFGHAALRTTAEQLEEEQPLARADLLLVMDGRLDNWEELRADLLAAGARLATRADAELVLAAYQRWGEGAFARLDGEYALALWDAARRRLTCVRDKMGRRPFLYARAGATLAFASEPGALIALPFVDRTLDEGVLAEFLATDWRTREGTLWRAIRQLGGASTLEADAAGARIAPYWAPDVTRRIRYRRHAEYVEHYRELLFDTVRRASRSHRPVAFEVSGGLDSSALFAVADRLGRQGRLPAPDIRGYTLKLADGSAADEMVYARAVGAHLGRALVEVPPTLEGLDWHLREARRSGAFPPYPNGAFGWGIRAQARADGAAVLIDGVGGDQFLTATHLFYADLLRAGEFAAFARRLRADARASGGGRAAWWVLRRGL
jgi:asparagine synthase (glutamine-hydrolysing)